MRPVFWTDSDIVNWAACYLSDSSNTLNALEAELGVSHSTIWWCFVHRLRYIDGGLYLKCAVQLSKHRGSRCYE